MATWNPPADLLRRQIESIRNQTYGNFACFIADDASSPEALAAIHEITAGDERFVVRSFSERVGFYRNFERALSMVPPEAAFVALADQDDCVGAGQARDAHRRARTRDDARLQRHAHR